MSAHEQLRLWLSMGTSRWTDESQLIVEVALRKTSDEAIDWRIRHGDPSSDPISALLLACEAGYDGAAILKSAIEIGDYALTTVDKRPDLATAVLELLFKSILSFPELWGASIN